MAALSITGLTGETAPAVETDLGSVQCVRLGSGDVYKRQARNGC